MQRSNQCHLELVKRFLRTAVLLDDQAYIEKSSVLGAVVKPDRRTAATSRQNNSPIRSRNTHSLDARSIMHSFLDLGVICGVIEPKESTMPAVEQADIIILDWLLRESSSDFTLEILRNLLANQQGRNSLRLIAIYTGEAQLDEICTLLMDELSQYDLGLQSNEISTSISYKHGRFELYAKANVNVHPDLKDRVVTEADLPHRLIEDFSIIVNGLLPRIVLTSLTAVREGEHKLLERFDSVLDPAFLSHRACLSDPGEAEHQIVSHIVDEIRGLVDEAIAVESPAGAKAVERWIRRSTQSKFIFGCKELTVDETIELANKGLEHPATKLKKNEFKHLSRGFGSNETNHMDKRLAWIMSFRTVHNAPPPLLWMGTVVMEKNESNTGHHLICVSPRCDCVRLQAETKILFLPLISLSNNSHAKEQIVVKSEEGFRRLGVDSNPSSWILRNFHPTQNDAITATRKNDFELFEFTDTCNRKYAWVGELKAVNAQRIVQNFANSVSRIALDESEWLRRKSRQ